MNRVLAFKRMTPKRATRSTFREPREIPLYRLREAARFIGMPPSTLQKWAFGRDFWSGGHRRHSERLLVPADPSLGLLSFANLAEAHILEVTRKHRIPMPDVRAALDILRQEDPHESHPLLTGKFYHQGKRLFVETLSEKISVAKPTAGQRQLGENMMGLKQITRDLDFYLDRIGRDKDDNPLELFPVRRNANKHVVINFEIAGGQPIVAGTGIQVEFLRDLQRSGMSIPDIASQYRLQSDVVAEAIEYIIAAWRSERGCRLMAKRDLLKLPDDFEGNLRALLATPPAPPGTAGSRKSAPEPPLKARKKQRKRGTQLAKAGTYAYEMAPVVKKRPISEGAGYGSRG